MKESFLRCVACAGIMALAWPSPALADPNDDREYECTVIYPLKGPPRFIISTAAPDGIAGAVLYTNTAETSFRYNPGAPDEGPAPIITFDDVPIPDSILMGATAVNITKVTYGIRRGGTTTSPPGQPTDVAMYWTTISTTATKPDTQLDQPVNAIGSASLPTPTATGFTTELVVFGDGENVLFTAPVNREVVTAPEGVFGTFLLGVSFSNPSAANGWRVTSGPDANANVVWTLDNKVEAAVVFGPPPEPPPSSTLYLVVEGVPVAPCVADVNGDSVVDVNDLLDMIAVWGSADPDADLTGDGVVDVNDLLALIGGWGCGIV